MTPKVVDLGSKTEILGGPARFSEKFPNSIQPRVFGGGTTRKMGPFLIKNDDFFDISGSPPGNLTFGPQKVTFGPQKLSKKGVCTRFLTLEPFSAENDFWVFFLPNKTPYLFGGSRKVTF